MSVRRVALGLTTALIAFFTGAPAASAAPGVTEVSNTVDVRCAFLTSKISFDWANDPTDKLGRSFAEARAKAGRPEVALPPYLANGNASGTVELTKDVPRPFLGVRLTTGCHCDAEGASTDGLCTLTSGTPQAQNVAALQTFAVAWARDAVAGTTTARTTRAARTTTGCSPRASPRRSAAFRRHRRHPSAGLTECQAKRWVPS